MSYQRGLFCAIFLAAIGMIGLESSFVRAQAKSKPAIWWWSIDVKARMGGTSDWDKARKIGIEVYKDENSGNLIYISETGHTAVVPAGATAKPAAPKGASWLWGLNLKARMGGNADFDKARKYGIEVFKDEQNGHLIYLCETGAFAVIAGGNVAKPDVSKTPTWMWDTDIKVRPAGIADWDKSRNFGNEVFKDENAGNLVYINETGAIAVIPAGKTTKPEKSKPALWMWDLDLKARPGGIDDWNKARKYGTEVYKDDNGGNLIYLSETGSLAVLSAGAVTKPTATKKPNWLFDLDLKARPAGVDDWDKSRKFGNEIYKDEYANNLVFLCETGFIAVIPAK
ncbi:MAG: hypothetical protein K2R98_01250 [Gemmataceae bacterium]|nr:hypothetical protein [Gemmataceae bacterium]